MRIVAGVQSILQHRVTVQAQIILNHAVSHLLGHLVLRHLMFREVLSSEFAAIDRGGESVGHRFVVNRKLLHAGNEWLVDLMVFLDGIEVNHCGGVDVVVGSGVDLDCDLGLD